MAARAPAVGELEVRTSMDAPTNGGAAVNGDPDASNTTGTDTAAGGQPPVPVMNNSLFFDVNHHIPEDVSGHLQRKTAFLGMTRTFTYRKIGIFLEEYKGEISPNNLTAVYDLSIANVDKAAPTGKQASANWFRLLFRSGTVLELNAPSKEEKERWTGSIQRDFDAYGDGRRKDNCPAALIAPIRRRHMSLQRTRSGTAMTQIGRPVATINDLGRRREEPFRIIGTLRLHIMEAEGLCPQADKRSVNPYCVVVVDNGQRVVTSTKTGTLSPFFGEEFFFDSAITDQTSRVTVFINNQLNKRSRTRDTRIGVVEIDLNTIRHGRPIDQWFSIDSPSATTSAERAVSPISTRRHDNLSGPASADGSFLTLNSLGSHANRGYGALRIKLIFTIEKIMPFHEYNDLLEAFIDPELACAAALARVANTQLDEVAGTLVNIFAINSRVRQFVRTLTTIEILQTSRSSIMFRGNSLGTKVIDMYMKMVGLDYLNYVLGDLINEVLVDKESCEVDPTRLGRGDDLKRNQKKLIGYCKAFFNQISLSVKRCPDELKQIFLSIQTEIKRKYPEGIEQYTSVSYVPTTRKSESRFLSWLVLCLTQALCTTAMPRAHTGRNHASGFIFLRFFCPAILNPALFGLSNEIPTGRVARTLTLIAKVIQNLANMVTVFDKEPYMKCTSDFLTLHLEAMRMTIDRFSTPSQQGDIEMDMLHDQRDLSREMSALQRHCVEKFEELLAASRDSKDESLRRLCDILGALERKQHQYEVSELAQRMAAVTGTNVAVTP